MLSIHDPDVVEMTELEVTGSLHEAPETLGVGDEVVLERIAANGLPTLLWINKAAVAGLLKPASGLPDDAQDTLVMHQFGKITVVDAWDRTVVEKPWLHVRQVAVEVWPQ